MSSIYQLADVGSVKLYIESMSTLHLDKLLDPGSIALVGASARETSLGHKLTRNLLLGDYKGRVFLVNPRYPTVLGTHCYRSIKAMPETPDLAILTTPSHRLRRTLVECSHKGIKVAMVMSGTENSQALHRYAEKLGMRIVGPYCAGLIRPHLNLNASYSHNTIAKGTLAIVSQSASLAAAMLDWAQTSNVGFSALLSTGDDTDISLSDLLDLLAEDHHTRAVIVYVDRVKDIRAFLSALSATARIKPVVLMRSPTEAARFCDALTRNGEVYTSSDVLQSALNRAGVVRIRNFQNLFAAAKILSTRTRVKGDRLAIISNGQAPAMMAVERMEVKHFRVPPIDEKSRKNLSKHSNEDFSGSNPLILRHPQKLAEQYVQFIDAVIEMDRYDAILVIFIPDARNDPDTVAQLIIDNLPKAKPLLACWMGDASVLDAREKFSHAGVATFRTPEDAIDGFDFLHRYYVSQQQLLQLPNPASRKTRADANAAQKVVGTALATGRRVMSPKATRELLELFDVPVLASRHATTLTDATTQAKRLGFPVAMKLVSANISYKASVITTQLNLQSVREVQVAWQRIKRRLEKLRPDATFDGVLVEAMHAPSNQRQLALSLSRDATFGPTIGVGIGGDLTALAHVRAVQLPPLNRYLIQDLLNNRDIRSYMGAFRHSEAVSSEPVAHILRRLSEMACEIPDIHSLDINPLVVSSDGAVAMDVQVVLENSQNTKLYSHLAIHPYPWQWMRDLTLKNNRQIQLRPIRPDDATSIITLVKNMSAESRYFRFMHAINELSPQMVAQFTKLDYDRQMAFVAVSELNNVVGVSRYMMTSNRLSGEFAISVSDDWQGLGLASSLMRLLMEHAKDQGLQTLQGDVLRTNTPMQGLMKSLGFKSSANLDEPEVLLFTYTMNEPL